MSYTYLQGKTPISFLQELCTKRGISPQYDLIANEGAVHEPTFVFRVTGGGFIGTGKGPSKKKAKHNAAVSLLSQMNVMATNHTNGGGPPVDKLVLQMMLEQSDNVTPHNGDNGQGPVEDGMPGNPVGELQELTQKRLWPPPIYDFTSEQGPPHAREFICTVRLWKLMEQGVGKSKKLSKRKAAQAMLTRIQQGCNMPEEPIEQNEDFEDDSIPLPVDPVKSAYSCLKEGKRVPTLTPQASQKISQFYQVMKNATGKNLAALQVKSLNAPSTNFCQVLQEIAEEQRFEVTYVDIAEVSISGQRQCLVQLSTMPVAVCHGVGSNTDEAHAHAAHNALQYLKIMTKKA